MGVVTPRVHARSAIGFVRLSVVCLSVVCQAEKIEICHIDPHKPSKGSQTIANSKKNCMLYVYLTEVKALRFAVFRLFL